MRFALLALLFLMGGLNEAWGQTDYSGTYYIANNNNDDYKGESNIDNYYLCPAQEFYNDGTVSTTDKEMPFLTTYKTQQDFNSLWKIEKVSGQNYYTIKHISSSKYVTVHNAMTGYSNHRRRVHLEEVTTLTDRNYFTVERLTNITNGDVLAYTIGCLDKYKSGNNQYLNPAGGNKDDYKATNNNETPWSGGIVGFFSKGASNQLGSVWFFEIPKPVVMHQDDATAGKISISCASSDVEIRYTTDGSEPTPNSTPYEDAFIPYNGVAVIKAKAFTTNNNGTSATVSFDVPQLPSPTITYSNETKELTISCSVTGATIYYTTDGIDPTTATTTSSNTSIVLSGIDTTTPFKAFAVKPGWRPSEIAQKTINKVTTPITDITSDSKVKIVCTTPDVTIYYTLDGSTPSTLSTRYTAPLDGVSGKVIKAIAVKDGWITSDVGGSDGAITLKCATPVIKRGVSNTFTITGGFPGDEQTTIYYTINGNDPTPADNKYTGPVSITSFPVTVKAIVKATGFDDSSVAELTINEGLAQDAEGYYEISSSGEFELFVNMVNDGGAGNKYRLTDDVSASSISPVTIAFTGEFDGSYHIINGLRNTLFNSINGGTVKNLLLDNVAISGGTNAGAICNEADGATKIYNCGVLGGSVSGSANVGGLVGLIQSGSSVRVVNCYSYANVSGSDCAAGIVGKNDGTVGDVRIAMCMMYGTVSGATTISPVYAGNHTSNAQNYTEYNYYLYSTQKDALGQRIIRIPYTKASGTTPSAYNDQLAIDKEEYLTRFPFYRHILNTHRELAAYFLFGDYSEEHVNEIGHWAVKKGDNAHKYPIVESWVKNKTNTTPTETNNDLPNTTADYAGKLLTTMGISGYLSVSIKIGGNNYSAKLPITDMDTLRNDYTYGKVILPFANEYKVNTDYSKICTGWKITGVSGGTAGTFENYNFADRDCTAKDIYNENTNPFIYAQGGYYIVPTGVKGITIEANFAEAVYLSDATYEIGYNSSYGGRTGVGDNISGFHGQTVYNSLKDAVDALSTATTNPHKQAIVLVGNYHYDLAKGDLATTRGFTLMSIDADNNQEPDYGFYSIAPDRPQTPALRFDFVPIIPLGMAAKVNGSNYYPGIPIWNSRGWYEQTETTVSIMNQFELDSGNFTKDEKDYEGKGQNPCIINGGYFVQMIRSRNTNCSKVSYFKIGGNAYIKEFYPGSHSSNAKNTTIVPVNVTGGQVDECYMTGYKSGAKAIGTDIRFWCSGGKIGKFLGAYMDTPMQTSSSVGNVNMTAKIDHALIGRFFGGGTSPNAAITGDINITINNSKVDFYCGGPEFGNMSAGKTVKTTANNTIFGKYYGAGFGGTAITYSPVDGSPSIGSSVTFPSGFYTYSSSTEGRLKSNGSLGLATCYKFEFLMHSADKSKLVARFITGYAKFDLATTGNVTNELTGCRVLNDFYGAGCQGKVNGTVTSTLTGCKIRGSAFGGGFKAESNEVQVYPADAPTLSVYNGETGIFSEFGTTTPETFTWVAGTENPDNAGHKLYTGMTEEHMKELGNVTGAISLTINGDSVAVNVFGGGNESQSLDNASVTIEGNTKVLGSVYGGGNIASVGTFTKDANGKSTSCADNTGKCTVVIKGNAEIGPDGMRMTRAGGPDDKGHVFGAGKGLMADPADKADIDFTAYVGNTDVTIKGNAFIKGSVYGGSENGHVLHDTYVKIQENCQIGNGDGVNRLYTAEEWANSSSLAECAHWDYDASTDYSYDIYAETEGYDSKGGALSATNGQTFYGNVFGGGSGYYPYAPGKWLRSAGQVEGNTMVNITGGHILTSVYGGNECTDVLGNCTINMSGGTVGVPRTDEEKAAHPLLGNVFGAGKGDKRVLFNTWTNVENTIVNISGGKIYGSVYGGGEDGHVLEKATTTISGDNTKIGTTGNTDYDGNVFGGGRGSATALTAGVVGYVELNVNGGDMLGSVYGGGRIASVGTNFTDPNDVNYGLLRTDTKYGVIGVNLKGGKIHGNVFGACMGTTVHDGLGVSRDVTLKLNEDVDDSAKGCIIKGNVFGCNNLNSSPQGNVIVHIYKTQRDGASRITNAGDVTNAKVAGTKTNGVYDLSTFDVKAVYGGGNMAAYMPTNASSTDDAEKDAAHTTVIIDGCDRTSIGQVYGGGNAASTPATDVTVNGTFEIGELFGGGNGKDRLPDNSENPGANVGFKNYFAVEDQYPTKESRQEEEFVNTYTYGSGKAAVNIKGGTIHSVFGGSNTKGNVRKTALTLLEELQSGGVPVCPFNVDEAYGGGKSAPMDAEAQLHMACIPGLKEAYGGAEAADIQGDVTLNITNGTFDRVFGGNNISGTIRGAIKVNIEETGCKPIIIGELYGGGNQAGYSVYGYDSDGTIIESGSTPLYADPEVNVKSFTSIGDIYGGGYGETAVMVGSPTVNINVGMGEQRNHDNAAVAEGTKLSDIYPVPSHVKGKIGAINNVFGGGNAAKVIGNTNVYIGTEDKVVFNTPTKKTVTTGEGDSATVTEEDTTEADRTHSVVGADIRGNVYGGGNEAEVTGRTNVVIGKKAE